MAYYEFSERLRKLMDMKGLNGADLARIANTTEASISRYTRGIVALPTTDILIELCRALGVSADYLLGIVDSYIEKDSLSKKQTLVMECLERASTDDIEVIWLILSKYMTASEKKLLDDPEERQSIG